MKERNPLRVDAMADKPSDPRHVRRARIFLAVFGAMSIAIAVVVAANNDGALLAGGFGIVGAILLLIAWLASDRWILRWEMLLTGWP